MRIFLPDAAPSYSFSQAIETRKRLMEALERAHAKDGDCFIGKGRLILTSPNGTQFQITVADDGTLSTTALP